MIKMYLVTVGILLTALTIAVSAIKPEINKPVQFSSGNFQIVSTELAPDPTATHKFDQEPVKIINTDTTQVKTTEKIVNTTAPKTTQTTKIIKSEPTVTKKIIEVKKQPETVKAVTKTVKTEPPKTTTKTITTEPVKTVTKTETVELEMPQSVKDIINNTQNQRETVVEVQPQTPVRLPQIDPTPRPTEKIIETVPENERPLTEQEEIIVWNIWRSNLQNQIMRDTEIAAPIGTTFKFSFTVDKNGRISNLRTWAIPSTYNSIAINYIKPLISSYQGQTILNFPARTKRVITNVTGGFVISTQDKFSTPNDFSDIERVKTLR